MKCVSLQVALFWKERMERPDTFANRINERLDNIFDAMPQIINLPADVPVDIPVVQMTSTTKSIQLNVSRNRCDLLINPNLMVQNSLGGAIQGFNDFVIKYLNAIFEEKRELVRIGIIATAFQEDDNAMTSIANKYFIEDVTKAKEINIRINQGEKAQGFELNNIVDITCGNLVNESLEINSDGIIYQRDINNVEKDENITLKTAKEIWKLALGYYTDKRMGEIR